MALRLANLEKKSPLFWMTTSCLLVAGIGVLDVVTGSELAFGFFYLAPIALTAWFSGRTPALATSVLSALAWGVADDLSGGVYSMPFIRYWNAAVRLGFFVVVSVLLPQLRALEHEKALGRVDYLTGTANRRHLLEMAQAELDRSRRYKRPFSIAYIDLDNFKTVNDDFGHRAGDRLLCAVADVVTGQLRSTDLIGRLGGDEFLVLMPELGHDAAHVIVPKVQSALLDEMQRNRWPVTVSVGALTYVDGPITAHELIERADDLMYLAKKNGKNEIVYGVCSTPPELSSEPL